MYLKMSVFVRVLMTLMLVAAVSGCAGIQADREVTRYADEGWSVNGIRLMHGTGGYEVLSVGRLAGEGSARVRQVEPMHRTFSAGFVHLQFFTSPDHPDELGQSRVAGEIEKVGVSLASALSRLVARFNAFSNIRVNLDVVLAPENSGAHYRTRSPMDEAVTISILFPFPGLSGEMGSTDLRAWWSQLASTISHELYHLHHDLSELGASRINEEVAASFIENCARLHLAMETGSHPLIDVAWLPEDPRAKRAFPGLEEGKFEPDQRALEKDFPLLSIRGRALGSAVLYVLTEGHGVHGDDPGPRGRILDYCDRLVREVPDFIGGDI